MPVGFGVSTETARSVVKNFKKQRKKIPIKGETLIRLPNGKVTSKSQVQIPDKETLLSISYEGQIWTKNDPYKKTWFKLDPNDPMNGEKSEFEFVEYTPKKRLHRERLLLVGVGNYMLEAYKERDNGNYNFSLCVLVGKEFTWHAEGLKENIIEKFGEDTYREWKEVVKKTRWQAQMCVDLARRLTDRIIGSQVCFESSRRFCKQVGLFVSEDEAFLIPKKYQY